MEKVEIVRESIKLVKISDKEYFGEQYKDYISNSKLNLINPSQGGSPFKYLNHCSTSDLSDSLDLGTAVHTHLLQPGLFKISDLRKPSAKLGFFIEEVFNYRKKGYNINKSIEYASNCTNYYNNKLTTNKLRKAIKQGLPFYIGRMHEKEDQNIQTLYLSNSVYNKFTSCTESLNSNKDVFNLLYPKSIFNSVEIYNEYAIFVDLDVTIDNKVKRLKFKAKLDNFTVDYETNKLVLNDLKTSGKPAYFFMGGYSKQSDNSKIWYDGSFQKYCYYRQLAVYLFLVNAWLLSEKNIKCKTSCNIILVETIPNYTSKIIPISNKYLKSGLIEFKKLIIEVAKITI